VYRYIHRRSNEPRIQFNLIVRLADLQHKTRKASIVANATEPRDKTTAASEFELTIIDDRQITSALRTQKYDDDVAARNS